MIDRLLTVLASLRLLIPLLLVLSTLMVSAALYLELRTASEREVTAQGLGQLAREMNRLQSELIESLRDDNLERARQQLSRALLGGEITRALLVDDRGRVLASSRLEWVGLDYAELEDALPTQRIEQLRLGQLGEIWIGEEGDRVRGLYPLPIGISPWSLRPDRIGFLEMSLDLGPEKVRLDRLAWRQTLDYAALLIGFSIALGLLLHWRITCRTTRLLAATRALAAGAIETRGGIRGRDELGELGAAFDRMAAELAASRGRLIELGEQRLALALDATCDAVWDYNLLAGKVYFSSGIESMLGYRPPVAAPDDQAWASLIHPHDRDQVLATIRAHLSGRTPKYLCEHRLRTADGDWLWVQARGRVVERDAAQRPLRMIGTYTDISERRLVEEERVLARMVFESASEAIIIADRRRQVVDVNPAFTRLSGYGRQEVIGSDCALISCHPTDDEGASDRASASPLESSLRSPLEIWEQVDTRGAWVGEIWDRRKGGAPYLRRLSINTIRDGRNRVSHYVGIFIDITEQKLSEEQLARLAYHDVLTGLPNRVLMGDRLGHDLVLARRHASPLAVLFIDLDRFKPINDTYGHDIGDALLVQTAQRLKAEVRESDTVARIAGDEFVILLPEVERHEIDEIASRILRAVGQPLVIQGHEIGIGASIGIAVHPEDGSDAATLLKHADLAMYQAKLAGRDDYRFFEPGMTAQTEPRQAIKESGPPGPE
ncbi:MAG: diguanylate cyclase [Sphingobacteriia bacterium]|nr:diguanylate cyclase [Sphingobacteriia bacterium]NCC40525.1 diguanylate cyclase [Gammaproteobacteria bacterium]